MNGNAAPTQRPPFGTTNMAGPPKQPQQPNYGAPQEYGGMQQRRPSGPHASVAAAPPQNGNPFVGGQPRLHPRPSPPPSSTAAGAGGHPPPPVDDMRHLSAAAANRQPQPPQARGGGPPFHTTQGGPPPQGAAAGGNKPLPPKGGGPPGGMRELRVEDALIYLDDVKREFGDRPTIYNEFLEIMKNFKSQEVDTPGVIDRVSRLFRGYNKLILGFNKFLPDGYKISLQDLERQDAERAALEARERQIAAAQGGGGAAAQPQPQQQGSSFGGGYQQQQARQSGPPSGQSPPTQQQQSYQQQAQQRGPPAAAHPPQGRHPGGPSMAQQQQQRQQQPQRHMPPQQAPPPAQQQQQHQAVEFDHAISYVTNIKKRFANDPGTYHAFLEILHTYQKEQRGIKEVLEQVAALFADHPDLLKEFTFFLPDAVQEQAKERLHRAAAESESRMAAQARGETYEPGSSSSRHVMSPGYGGMRVETGRLALQQAQASSSGGQKFIDMTGQVCFYGRKWLSPWMSHFSHMYAVALESHYREESLLLLANAPWVQELPEADGVKPSRRSLTRMCTIPLSRGNSSMLHEKL